MSSGKYIKTKFEGVFYRESQKLDPRTGTKDRIYYFWYADAESRGHWKSIGRHSQGYRPQTARQARMDFLSALSDGRNLIEMDRFTMGDTVDLYVEWARGEGKSIDRPLQQYNKHMRSRIHAIPLSSVTPAILTSIRNTLSNVLAPQSILHQFSFLRRAINHAIARKKWFGSTPVSSKAGGWKMPTVDNGRVRVFTPEEVKYLLADLQKRSPQLHDMALLSLKTGLRATEIFKLKRQDIDPHAGIIHITAKGGERQVIHASSDMIDMLLGYCRRPKEYIFQTRGTDGAPISRISNAFRNALSTLGIDNGNTDSRYHVTFHTFRHTFASWLAQSGQVTLLELKVLMRHESISMTQRYAHLIPGQTAKKMAIIDSIIERQR